VPEVWVVPVNQAMHFLTSKRTGLNSSYTLTFVVFKSHWCFT